MTLPLLLLGFAALLLAAGSIVSLIAAFRVSVTWGLLSFLVPFGIYVFTVVHWTAARRGFFLQLAGVPFCIGAFVLLGQMDSGSLEAMFAEEKPETRAEDKAALPAAIPDSTPAAAAAPVSTTEALGTQLPPLPEQIYLTRVEQNKRRFTQLEVIYSRLSARRTTLEIGDPVAVRTFNADVATYRADLRAAQLEKQELKSRRPPEGAS